MQRSIAQSGQKWATGGNNISSSDFLGTTNNQPLRLYTNNTEKIRITPQGNVGINTTTPQYLLDVNGRGRFKGWLLADSNLTISGYLGINTLQPQYHLDVNGSGWVRGTLKIGNSIILNGETNEITSTAGTLDFGNTNIQTAGTINVQNIIINGSEITPSPFKATSNGIVIDESLLNTKVYLNDLYTRSLYIGEFRLTNSATVPSAKDSIITPNPLEVKSPAVEMRTDTVIIKPEPIPGIPNNEYRVLLDVYGNAKIRGWINAEDGVIVGKQIEGERIKSDTAEVRKAETKELTTRTAEAEKAIIDTLNARTVKIDSILLEKAEITELNTWAVEARQVNADSIETKKLRLGGQIYIDGLFSTIYSSEGTLRFNNNNLNSINKIITTDIETNGKLNAENIKTKRITSIDSLLILGDSSIYINTNANHIFTYPATPIYIQSKYNSGNGHTVLNLKHGNVGIGKDNPQVKLHISSREINGTVLRLENYKTASTPPMDGFPLTTWDMKVFTDNNNTKQFQIINVDNNKIVFSSNEYGNAGIGKIVSDATLHLYSESLNGCILRFDSYLTGSENIDGYPRIMWDIKVNAQNGKLYVGLKDSIPFFTITKDGNIGIKTILTNNTNNYTLAVNGFIGAKEVYVENISTTWPDYVFNDDYKLMSLKEIEAYIKEYKHLPEVPSASQINKDGLKVGEINTLLLKKIEELTLYIIQQQKEINFLKKKFLKEK